MNGEITKEGIKQLMIENNLTITKCIDVAIELNGIVGVGLITLGDQLKEYTHNKITPNPNFD
jgi:hypothetical protein